MKDERRCRARSSRTGKRCGKAAILGGTVCRTHGGAAGQVKAKAQERLLALVDPALAVLYKIVTRGEADDLSLKAARDILDRAGFARATRVQQEVSGGEGEPVRFTLNLTGEGE